MKKATAILCLTLCFALCLGALPALAREVTFTDMTGREIVLDQPASRIVALTPSDCEILCALGAEDLLVGRGAYCDYPEDIQQVPVVNSGDQTNLEEILALSPQVVLMATMAQTQEQIAALEAAGIRVVVSDAQDIEGVYQAIEMIGQLTGRQSQAQALVAQMQEQFQRIAAQAQDTGKTVYFEVSPLEWGLWTAGKGTFMDELAALCGLTNAFSDVEGWAQISEEQVLQRNPDYIVTVTMYYGEGPTPQEEIMSRAGWQDVTAVAQNQVFQADNDRMTRPGPRLMDAAQALYDFVYATQGEQAA
ncbi:MAG TPA: ABC transporter substrate-binding protein [Candidatus Excrementavichristensenella intestinipullorum]|nr:ABC transporter substrate-binding protein [Candidatus Excrementavichristensenella intestinipullorum]